MLNTFIVEGAAKQSKKVANVAESLGLIAAPLHERIDASDYSYAIRASCESSLREFRAVLKVLEIPLVGWCELASVSNGNDVMVVAKKDKDK